MLKTVKYLPRIFLYNLEKRIGFPTTLPINLTLSVTNRCNSRCKICNIWKRRQNERELTVKEYGKIFKDFKTLFWVTVMGGEPTLREDLDDIITTLYRETKPKFITLSTNGYETKKLVDMVKKTLKNCQKTNLVVNFSLDGLEELNDEIRGVSNAFEKTSRSYRKLKDISENHSRLTIGINTVLSKINIERFPEIFEGLMKMRPGSYAVEVAEGRANLYNKNLDVFPGRKEYTKALKFLIERMKEEKFDNTGKIIRKLRLSYYRSILEDNFLTNYEGISSAYIMPNGDVWLSHSEKESIGNLLDFDFSFKRLWCSSLRREVLDDKQNSSGVRPANLYYNNLFCNPFQLLKSLLG